jgi:hypothetical protein
MVDALKKEDIAQASIELDKTKAHDLTQTQNSLDAINFVKYHSCF